MHFSICTSRMNNPLLKTIQTFIKIHCFSESPVLLAFSGGPDSLALMHLLFEYRRDNPSFSFALAHVDHGWRPESAQEVKIIEEMAKKFQLVVHFKKLNPQGLQGNLEAACREERLQFFADLCIRHGYQGVMLGHHADDLAETVFKRVLEGVTLPYLCGMRAEIEMWGMKVWRPLLTVKKKELVDWLSSRGLQGFDDVTNSDPKFMRARLRTRILPELSKDFGKEVASALCQVSRESGELRDYMNDQIAHFLDKIEFGIMGGMLDLGGCEDFPQSLFEIKYLVRRFCELNEFLISRHALDDAAEMLMQRVANKSIEMGKKALYVDRRRLFIPNSQFEPLPKTSLVIQEGEVVFGRWRVSMIKLDNTSKRDDCSDWRKLWKDKGEIVLPIGEYEITVPDIKQLYVQKISLGDWWSKYKVPTFLRMHVPVITRGSVVCHEFLTGKRQQPLVTGARVLISLRAEEGQSITGQGESVSGQG